MAKREYQQCVCKPDIILIMVRLVQWLRLLALIPVDEVQILVKAAVFFMGPVPHVF